MKSIQLTALVMSWAITLPIGVSAQAVARDGLPATKAVHIMPDSLLKLLVGSWEGECRTWLEPGKLADESRVRGAFRPLLGGRFVRHEYQGTMQGRPRHGDETIAFNAVTKHFEVSWVDEFHMNYGIMFSTGEATERGFVVKGTYDVAPGTPPWGWKTVFEVVDGDHLTITAYNVTPDGQEAMAVETKYVRTRS